MTLDTLIKEIAQNNTQSEEERLGAIKGNRRLPKILSYITR